MNRLEKAAAISAAGNAFVAILKFFVGTAFGSIALVADAVHSFTDIVSSIAVFFGVRFSTIKTKAFPYGLYKLENLVSLFISLIIFWSGYEIVSEAIQKIGLRQQLISVLPILVAAVSLIIILALTKYKQKVGKEENSPAMISEARHSLLDVYGTVGVLAAVSLSFIGYPVFDSLIGLIIGLLVFKAGVEIFSNAVKVLLDASLDYNTMKKIERIVLKQKNVEVKELLARNSGRFIFVDLKLETGLKDLKRVNLLQKRCEEQIKAAIPRIDKITIEIEYKKKPVLVYAVPLQTKSKNSVIAPAFSTAPFFGLIKATNKPEKNEILQIKIIENPFAKEATRRGIATAELIAKHKVDVLLVKQEMHKGGGYYALQDAFIEVQKTKVKTFKQLLEEFK